MGATFGNQAARAAGFRFQARVPEAINQIMKSTGLSLILISLLASSLQGEQFRTDINPALKYYQAFILAPDLSPTDHDYLLTNEWRGQKLPERVGELLSRYDNQFTMVRQAAYA